MTDFLLSPLIWILAGAAGWVLARRRWRWPGAVVFIGGIALATPAGSDALIRTVEWDGATPASCEVNPPAVIVALAGGTETRPHGADDLMSLNAASLRRAIAAGALFHALHASRLIVVGGGPGPVPESRLVADFVERLGVPASDIQREETSIDTWQNATHLLAVGPTVPKRFWLVSSALHLPRALVAFRAAGFDPCPSSSGSLVSGVHGLAALVPEIGALGHSRAAIHEWVGGWLYRWRATRAGSHLPRGQEP